MPESEAVIESVLPTATRLYVSDIGGGPSRLRSFDHAGRAGAELPLLHHGMGTPLDAEVAEAVDLYGFLLSQLGIPFRPTPGG